MNLALAIVLCTILEWPVRQKVVAGFIEDDEMRQQLDLDLFYWLEPVLIRERDCTDDGL